MARKYKSKSITSFETCSKCQKDKVVGDCVPMYVRKKYYWVCFDCRELWLEKINEN